MEFQVPFVAAAVASSQRPCGTLLTDVDDDIGDDGTQGCDT